MRLPSLSRMVKSETQSPLLPDRDVESQNTVIESHEDVVSSSTLRKSLNGVLVMGMCCIAFLLGAAAVFCNSQFQTGVAAGGLLNGGAVADSDNDFDFYRASHTGFHFQPPKNWMNDPNAPMLYKGYYHFFYQYNPDAAVWGNISWGHAVSTDLINWIFLEVALYPDEWYDIEGVWSGSATILKDGTPAIIYTGGRNNANGECCVQSQNLALPVDYSDPLLREWRKVESNPIIAPPEDILPQDFRDPTTAWLEDDGYWRMSIGTKKNNDDGTKDGMGLLYKSMDFSNWEREENYLHKVEGSGMWECVDFFPVTVEGKKRDQSILQAENYLDSYKYVLKASLDTSAQDHYTIGTYSTETHVFTADDPALDIGRGYRYDYGKFYASKTFYDSLLGRRILWSWVPESDTQQDDVEKGWASVMAIPRTLWLDGMTFKNLLQWPVEEVDSLRRGKTSYQNIDLMPEDVLKVEGGDGSQLDIVIAFEKPDVSSVEPGNPVEFDCNQGGSAQRGIFGPFGLLVHTDDAQIEQTSVFFYIAYTNDGQWSTRVCSDQSRSSLAPGLDQEVYGTTVTVLPTENELSLRILVDHSIVETFVQGGRLVITSRVYPTVAIGSNSHLFLFNNGTTPVRVNSLDVYKMIDVHMYTMNSL